MASQEIIDPGEDRVMEAINAPGIVPGLSSEETFIYLAPKSLDIDAEREKYVNSGGRAPSRHESGVLDHKPITFKGWLEKLGIEVIREDMTPPQVY